MNVIARMAVEVAGEGEPVLCIHGLGGTSNTFTPQVSALGSRFRVIRPDLPGSGRSPVPASLSIGAMVAALVEMCEVLNVHGAHVVAHSLGTIVAQHLAVERPALVRSLFLLGALGEPSEAARVAIRGRAADVRAKGMQGSADAVLSAALSADTKSGNLAAVAFVRESLMRQPPNGYALTCEALADARAAELRGLRLPALLLTREDDAVAPRSGARLLAERIEGARAETLPRCGHWASIERAEEVNRRLLAHLAPRSR